MPNQGPNFNRALPEFLSAAGNFGGILAGVCEVLETLEPHDQERTVQIMTSLAISTLAALPPDARDAVLASFEQTTALRVVPDLPGERVA